eukprot:NODE_31627_length_392_cov_6.550943.p2 GENE.NODE_31627_length_392_cov_6.550943~~NODE_31627_length_392_cov_6.550943.p2  ORF type:complete len:83 (+),score=1.96 NODE_31627_length_392_cov_6.550943:109-357(+)
MFFFFFFFFFFSLVFFICLNTSINNLRIGDRLWIVMLAHAAWHAQLPPASPTSPEPQEVGAAVECLRASSHRHPGGNAQSLC